MFILSVMRTPASPVAILSPLRLLVAAGEMMRLVATSPSCLRCRYSPCEWSLRVVATETYYHRARLAHNVSMLFPSPRWHMQNSPSPATPTYHCRHHASKHNEMSSPSPAPSSRPRPAHQSLPSPSSSLRHKYDSLNRPMLTCSRFHWSKLAEVARVHGR